MPELPAHYGEDRITVMARDPWWLFAYWEIRPGPRKGAETVEMRLDMAKQRLRQMQTQQIRQRRIGPVEIHSRGVGCEQTRLTGSGNAILLEWLHVISPCPFRPILIFYR